MSTSNNVIYHNGQRETSHFLSIGERANKKGMEIDETFRASLKRLREDKGMDAKELSKLAGLGERGVKDIEEGRSQSPKISTAYKLAKALDADLIQMMGLNHDPKIAPEWIDFLLQYDEAGQQQLLGALALIPAQPSR